MAGHFRTLLEGIVAHPNRPIAEFPILTPAEAHQILVEWNDTQTDYPKDTCIYELFEAQVNKTPESPAVIWGEQRLTYQELNCRANQVARHLRKNGIQAGTRVGICVERSLDMIIGLFGILKAGG